MAGFPGMPHFPMLDTSNPMLAAMQAQLDNQAALQNLLGQSMGMKFPGAMGQPVGLPSSNPALLGASFPGLLSATSSAGHGVQSSAPQGLSAFNSPPSGTAGNFHSQPVVDTARELLQRQSAGGAMTPAQETSARLQRMKEDKAEKDATTREEAEKSRCHLHKKPKKGCKKCDKYEEFLNRGKAEKAALKEKFVNDVRREHDTSIYSEPSTNKRGPIELGNTKTFGFPPLFQSHIVESTHFRNLMTQETFEEVVDEIVTYGDSVEPYMANTATTPSPLFCCVYRLFTLSLDGQDLVALLEGQDSRSPYTRCAGFLFVRYGMPVDQLWSWLGEYTLDTEQFEPVKGGDMVTTVGEYVEGLLTLERYYTTILPRLPVGAKRHLEAKLAQVPQYRKRTVANMKLLDVYRQQGVRVEAFLNDAWVAGETLELDESFTHRVRLRIRLSSGSEEIVHIGMVILSDSRFDHKGGRSRAGRERSRSRSPTGVDWAREKGRDESELLREFRGRARDQAVCASGKDYARRPVSFNVALPMEQGTASHRLIQEETFVSATKAKRDRSPSPSQAARKGPSLEHQARMHEIFKKYTAGSSSAAAGDGGHNDDVDGPDVMRIG